MTMRRFAIALVSVGLSVVAPVWAKDVTEFDRFSLWNECKPLQLLVASTNQEATKLGLTRESVEIAARSRLRAARIYTAEKNYFPPTTIYVNAHVGRGNTFFVSVELWKWLEDEINKISGFWRATTWDTYGFGTHGGNSTTIISIVSQRIDHLIDEYLRVNAAACKS